MAQRKKKKKKKIELDNSMFFIVVSHYVTCKGTFNTQEQAEAKLLGLISFMPH